MPAIDIHPSELAYAFSYSRTEDVIGWGREPFLPAGEEDGDPADWLDQGAERLVAAGRLVGAPEEGYAFTDDMTATVLTLANPGLVLLAQRKEGDSIRVLTVHLSGEATVGMVRRADGMFELTPYEELTAAAGASASFVGAAFEPLDAETRIEANQKVLARLVELVDAGEGGRVVEALGRLGAGETEAGSAIEALTQPAAAGVVSVLYCANNTVEDAESFSVMTTTDDQSWIVFPPAEPDGPMVLERSSVGALAARISVGVAARLGLGT